MKLMLAQTWRTEQDPTGWWMSRKLDGARAVWDGARLLSRNGATIAAPADWLAGLPVGVALDGELYLGPGRYRELMSLLRRAGADWSEVTFQVFDLPTSSEPFEARMVALAAYHGCGPVRYVTQTRCVGRGHLSAYEAAVLAEGVEGVMLRAPGSMYDPKRSASLRKLKRFRDAEGVILAHEHGPAGEPSYLVRCCVTGAEFRLRDLGLDREPVGTVVTYAYQERGPDGTPRFAIFVGPRSMP